MAKLSKQDYNFLKSLPKEDLTQEDLNDIHEYESLAAGTPTEEDIQWATTILNEKNPLLQTEFRKSGDTDKALSIINQSRSAKNLMIKQGLDTYIKTVTSTPDDVVKDSGFNFNWRGAYENVKNEKLRPTEADAKKLQDFINSNMYDVNDDVNLQQIAYNLHMYNPNTMKWTDFINSEQGAEFKKYLDDVRKAQTEKAVEDIWEGKDDKTFGDKFSTAAVNFMLPVSKEYARNHYNDEDFSLAGPLMTDAAANLVMAGPGAAEALPAKVGVPVAKVLNRPLISTIYGNVAAPAITETGNVIYNDESIPEAIARTVEGTAINIGTPRILESMLSSAGRGLPIGESRSVQKMIDEAANKAAKIQDDIRKGKSYSFNIEGQPGPMEFIQVTKDGKKFYSSDIPASQKDWPSRKFESIKDMPVEAVTLDEFGQLKQGIPFLRGKDGNNKFANTLKAIQDDGAEYLQDDLIAKKATALAKDGDLRNLTPVDLRQLGFADKESLMNYLIRNIKMKMPSTFSTYMTNAAGRPEFGREAGPIENINRLLGTSLFKKDNTGEEKQKSRIQRLLGL